MKQPLFLHHDPRHYRFERTCPDFHIDRTHPGDTLVFRVCAAIAIVAIIAWWVV